METFDVAVIGGGQSGLAAAHALRARGVTPVVLEASGRAAGSWPHYYDSLALFSPARHSSLPGMPFGGDPDRYPHRDEVVDYLQRYAARLDADIRTGTRVMEVRPGAGGYEVVLEGGGRLAAKAVVAASGSFGNPYRPPLPGLENFGGEVLHAAEYRAPEPFADRHVVVVGAGNSAVQIATELSSQSRVTLATRAPVKFARQRLLGRDLHAWLAVSGLDAAPLGRLLPRPPGQPVLDGGRYRAALAAGSPARKALFTAADGTKVTWSDGLIEEVDAIVLATGYRPDLPYLAPLGTLHAAGRPLHRGGLSTVRPRLAYLGLEWQRSLSSNSLRGVGRDAAHVAHRLTSTLANR
ncbi:flavin-containing monooxygenase [Kitasatospora sp. NPDC057965]|uniref:flavin-containing monooxygenase n=1 Tax=Kitasatospora sp. NPDC057965 TaxID=3346291 RepID=UPI0036DE2D8D